MNPFVDPKKRSFLLPDGCKDLIDVLNQTKFEPGSSISSIFVPQSIIRLVLSLALRHKATELIFGIAPPGELVPVKYKTRNSWHKSPVQLPPNYRPEIISELLRMAKMPAGKFPSEGILDVTFGGVRSRWTLKITSPDAECLLVRLPD